MTIQEDYDRLINMHGHNHLEVIRQLKKGIELYNEALTRIDNAEAKRRVERYTKMLILAEANNK